MLVQVPCQTQKRDETGMSRWKRAETASGMERIAPVGGAIRTTTYGGYEAIRPAPPRPWGQPSATRSASSTRSGLYRPHSPQAWPTSLNDFAT